MSAAFLRQFAPINPLSIRNLSILFIFLVVFQQIYSSIDIFSQTGILETSTQFNETKRVLSKENLSILYTTSCHKGHINPNAGIARELTSRGHRVDLLTTGLCEEIAWQLVPKARDVIELDLHPQKCLDPGDVLDMISAARDLYIEKHTIQAFNATMRQLQKKKYDILVGNFVVPGGIIAAKVYRIPVVSSTVGPIFVLYQEEADSWDFEVQVNLPSEDSMPNLMATTVRTLLSLSHYILFSPIFSFIQQQHNAHGLSIADSENDGSLPFSYYYRHTVMINQGLPQLNLKNFSKFYEDDNIFYHGFAPDELLYPPMLDKTLVEFLDSSDKPVVYISLGTVFDVGKDPQVEFLRGLENQTKFRFVWAVLEKYDLELNQEQKNRDNLFIGSYLPQGSILKHDNTKIFLTHCGANSVQDAVYAGTPMLTYPGFGDQVVLSKRIIAQGMGRRIMDLRFDKLEAPLSHVLEEHVYDSFVHNITKFRKFMLSLGGYKAAADVIEETAVGAIVVNPEVGSNLGSYSGAMRVVLIVLSIKATAIVATFIALCYKVVNVCRRKHKIE